MFMPYLFGIYIFLTEIRIEENVYSKLKAILFIVMDDLD